VTLRIPAASVFVALIILSAVVVARGQSATAPPEASAKRLTFEVASIKRNVSADAGGSVRVEPGNRLIVTNIPLVGLVRHAHGTQRWEMLPGGDLPSWMQTERWDIRAMAAADATPAQVNDMFKNLLADRFKLVARREARQIPVYNLVRARADGRLGPQLRASASDCSAARAATPSCRRNGFTWSNHIRGRTMDPLPHRSQSGRRPVHCRQDWDNGARRSATDLRDRRTWRCAERIPVLVRGAL
jgi:hypothetical protein